MPGTIEVATAYLSEPRPDVVAAQSRIALHTGQTKERPACAACPVCGPGQQCRAETIAGAATVDHQTVHIRSVGRPGTPDRLVRPEEPQTSHDLFALTHDEPLAVAHLRPDIFQCDFTRGPLLNARLLHPPCRLLTQRQQSGCIVWACLLHTDHGQEVSELAVRHPQASEALLGRSARNSGPPTASGGRSFTGHGCTPHAA